MNAQVEPGFMVLCIVGILILGSILAAVMNRAPSGTTPLDTGKTKLPGPDRSPEEEDDFRFALDRQLNKREDLPKAFGQGGLKGRENAAEACRRWRQYACRKQSLSALALATALSRLCPEGLSADEAQARQEELISLTGEGEGHFLLGLSSIRLYAHFRPQDERTARDAWRQAVEHFRISGHAGHRDGMEAAALLCACGHDLPFTPPEDFQACLPLLKASNTDEQETFYWDLDMHLAESPDYPSMHLRLPFEAANPSAPEALFWDLQLAEAGDSLAMHYLATLWAGTEPPDRARAEDWYRRSMEAGNRADAADALAKCCLAGILPDETGRKTAICLIVSACDELCAAKKIPAGQGAKLSAANMAELKEYEELSGEAGQRVREQLDACKAEGEALHAQARRALQVWISRRQEENVRCLNAARQKLAALCEGLEDSRQPERETGTDAPAHDDRPHRSFARPDKR